jgi:hypothetical protein
VTIAKRPSCGRETAGLVPLICPTGKAKYFSLPDWTAYIDLIFLRKLTCARTRFRTFRSYNLSNLLGLSFNRGLGNMSVNLAALAIGDFAPHRDTMFELKAANDGIPLKLVKVDNVGDSGRAGGAFSLLFAAPKGTMLRQAIYPVTHPSLGMMEIFLVPIGPLAGGSGYQAIFT